MCESLIGTLKIEKLDRNAWRSVEDVRAAVFEWIETWYKRRRHSALGYLSPLQYESQHHDGHPITTPNLSGETGELQTPFEKDMVSRRQRVGTRIATGEDTP